MEKDNSIKKASEEWIENFGKKLSSPTKATYERSILNHIIPVVGDWPLPQKNEEYYLVIKAVEEHLKKGGYSQKTKLGVIHLLIRILNNEELIYGPSQVRKQAEVIPEDEYLKLKKYLREDLTNPTNVGILIVMLIGLRLGEICSLKWSDIDMFKRQINVQRMVSKVDEKKNGIVKIKGTKPPLKEEKITPRVIPIPESLVEVLLPTWNCSSNYLLTGTLDPKDPRNFQYKLQRLCIQLGISNVTCTNLRETFAINSLLKGMNPLALTEILGLDYKGIQRYLTYARKCVNLMDEMEKLN